MSASLRLSFGVVAVGLSCLMLSYAIAQQDTALENTPLDASPSGQTDRATDQQADPSTAPGGVPSIGEISQNRTNYRSAQSAPGGKHALVDHFLAGCLLGKNKAEVELSQIALEKSENAEVKQFAQKMIQDHQKMIDQLQPLAAMQGGANRSTTNAAALPGSSGASQTLAPSGTRATAPADATAGTATTTAVAGGGAVHQLMQIDRQINERCLQMAKDELEHKSGAEFDKCYIGNAIGAHVHALAALEVIGKQTQGKLAQVAQQGQPTVQQHLDHAKQLMKQLDGQSSATGTRAQRETTRTD